MKKQVNCKPICPAWNTSTQLLQKRCKSLIICTKAICQKKSKQKDIRLTGNLNDRLRPYLLSRRSSSLLMVRSLRRLGITLQVKKPSPKLKKVVLTRLRVFTNPHTSRCCTNSKSHHNSSNNIHHRRYLKAFLHTKIGGN